MTLDPSTCFAALAARDPRFDGVFFVGVSTTGIYCRPVCTARTPRADRCAFFRTPAEAEAAGFRACFRCRPELAPGRAQVDAVPHLVARAVRLVDEGFLDRRSVEELSDRLGVSARHLRRAMQDALGLGPTELAQSRRLAFAKRLLQDTALPVGDVAFASGFSSVRRFNAAFAERFGRPPSSIRREPGAPRALVLRLDHRPPLDWHALLAFLGPRAVPGLERVEGDRWVRTVRLGGCEGQVVVRRQGERSLVAEVGLELLPVVMALTARLRRLFDLDARPDAIAARLAEDPLLAPLVAARPGLRAPGSLDPFEGAVRAVLGQQVSVRAATTLAGRLVERIGGGRFPAPDEVARASVDALAGLGMPGRRATALRAVASRFAEGREDLDGIEGIGPWTITVAALRSGDPDAFPAGDLGVRKALGGLAPADATKRAEAWRPWRSYAVHHLWSGGNP